MPFGGVSHRPKWASPKCKPVSLTGQSPSPWEMGSKDLIIFPFLQTLKTVGVEQGEHGGPEGSTKVERTFYFSSRGRDFRHTKVVGGHNVVVRKAVPRAKGQKGREQGRGIAGHSPPRKETTSVIHH